jgi:hypothetical protein
MRDVIFQYSVVAPAGWKLHTSGHSWQLAISQFSFSLRSLVIIFELLETAVVWQNPLLSGVMPKPQYLDLRQVGQNHF